MNSNSDEKDTDFGAQFRELLDASFAYAPPRRGEIRSAVILEIDEREIIVDLNTKRDGIVPYQDIERLDPAFRDTLVVGGEVPVYIMNPRDQDDNLVVSINMGLQQYDWEKARSLLESEDVVEVTVTGSNRGGILVRWNRLEGFVPSSHLVSVSYSGDRRDAWDELRDQPLVVKVIEVDQDRRRLIFSEREAQKEWRAQQKARLLAELKEGDRVKGTVTGLRDFGAFVNLGGADGLIHVSELAWHRVDHPRDILRVGQEIEVYVLNLDRESNRIALSRKRLLNDPWDDAALRYHEGQLVEGTVTNVVEFGAFVALNDGLEGLLHLSEMGDGSLKEPHSYVKKGDNLSLRISHLEPEKRRVGFTQRWGTDAADAPAEGEAQETSTESAAPEAEADVTSAAEAEVQAAASEAEPETTSADEIDAGATVLEAEPTVLEPETPAGEPAADDGSEDAE